MSAVVSAVKSVVGAVVDVVEAVGSAVVDVVDFVVDEIVEPVVNTVGNIIDSALDDPIKAIAQVAAIATGNVWALPLIEGADVAIAGGDLSDILEATAKAYVAAEVGSYVGRSVGNAAYSSAAAAGPPTVNSVIAADVLGRAAGSAGAAVVTGQDPLKAFVSGGVSAGVPAILGKVDGFTNLPKSAQRGISAAVTGKLLGKDVDATAIASMVAATEVTTRTLEAYDPDRTKLSDAEYALASDVLMATTSAALQGGNVSAAIQAQLIKAGTKQLGEMAKSGFKDAVAKIKGTYDEADKNAAQIEANETKQKEIIDKYNAEKDKLDVKIAEQDRLKKIAEEKVAIAKEDTTNKEKVDAANAATKEYNDYTKTVSDAYAEVKPILDGYSEDLGKLQVTHAELADDYEGLIKSLSTSTSPVQDKLDDIYWNTNEAFVSVLDPNFNADEYKKINKLGDDVNAYEHYLDKGQTQGLVTNNKDQSIVEAQAKYKEATGQDLPTYIVERARIAENDNRDVIIDNFVNTTLKDNEAAKATTDKAIDEVVKAYTDAGYSDAEITEKINSGEVLNVVNDIVALQKQAVDDLRNHATAVGNSKGTDSAEYKAAYKDALEAMADAGGYGVSKEGDTFVDANGGKIDPDTLIPAYKASSGVDPVTGIPWVEIYGTATSKPTEVEYSALLALGKSANPPEKGGASTFGDGSGVSSGLFGALTPVAFDDGSGDGSRLFDSPDYALIAYSNGKGAIVKKDTQEVVWVDNTDKILAEVPQGKDPSAPAPVVSDTPPPKVTDVIKDAVKTASDAIAASMQTPQEVVDALKKVGYTATLEEAAKLAGEKSVDQLVKEAQEYADPRMVDEDEARAAYEALGIKKPTADDVKKLMGQYEETGLTDKAKANLDNARYNSIIAQLDDLTVGASKETLDAIALVKSDLAKQVTDLGFKIDKTAEDLAGDISTVEKNVLDKVAEYEKAGADRDEALDKAITDVAADIGTTKKDILDKIGTPASVDEEGEPVAATGVYAELADISSDVQTKYDALTDGQKDLADALVAQGKDLKDAIDTASKATAEQIGAPASVDENGDPVPATGIYAELADISSDVQTKYDALTDGQKDLADALVAQGKDLKDAIDTAAKATAEQIGAPASVDENGDPVPATGIYAEIAGVSSSISDLSTDVQAKYDSLTDGQKALADQLTKQGVDLNTAIDTAKTEFKTALGETETRVTGEIQAVADLVGKPASQVTQGDIDYVKQFLAGGGEGQADLTYDYNGDGIVDANDQTALEGILSGTGGDSPFAPAAGSKWAATGIYGTIAESEAAQQKAIAEEAEKTRAANAATAAANRNAAARQAQQTQRMGNLNTMMGMLMQAPDIGGQQVTVKPADPAKIGYVYDWSSIFANPTQQKMFTSPFGSYAEGGMVEDDVNAELIKMLRS